MASHKPKDSGKKAIPTSWVETEKFSKQEQKKSPLDYLNHKRMVPSAGKPILSGAVDPFSKDDVDKTVDREDTLNRREKIVPVAGRVWD
jgi:hypothetical protein